MKVIKPGRKIEPATYTATCRHCEAQLEYTDADIEVDGCLGDYRYFVSCPECHAWITHRAWWERFKAFWRS